MEKRIVIHLHTNDIASSGSIMEGIRRVKATLSSIGNIGPLPDSARIREIDNILRSAKNDIEGMLVSLRGL